MQGVKGLRGVIGVQGPLGVQGPVGTTGVQGERGQEGAYGTQGLVGEQGDRSERGEKGIQDDISDVLSVLANHLPIQLAIRYGEKMCFVKYHVSEDNSSIVESSGGVSAYHETSWHFDGEFVDGQMACKGKCTESIWPWSFFRVEELGLPLPL